MGQNGTKKQQNRITIPRLSRNRAATAATTPPMSGPKAVEGVKNHRHELIHYYDSINCSKMKLLMLNCDGYNTEAHIITIVGIITCVHTPG